MTDRELLELAAKASGLIVCDRTDNAVSLRIASDGCKTGYLWNPLFDDGDALRLAVKLKMDVTIGQSVKAVCSFGDLLSREIVEIEEDPNASTRLAIVRAAAEIGKAMS